MKFHLIIKRPVKEIINVSLLGIVVIEIFYELYLDDDFAKMLGFSDKVLKRFLQRSDLTPQINSINYLKISKNIL